MLNGTNFKAWQENIIIVLDVMDLDIALSIERAAELTDDSFSDDEEHGKVGSFGMHKSLDHEACYSVSF